MLLIISHSLSLSPLQDAPKGFRVVDENEVQRVGRDPVGLGFMVSLVADKPVIETRHAWAERQVAQAQAKRLAKVPEIKLDFDGASANWFVGDGVRVKDGWIDGFDVGEWGGAVIWFSTDGKRHVVISKRNTRLVAQTSKGIFAFQDLDHLTFQYADLVKVVPSGSGWKTEVVASLSEAPRIIVQDQNRFLYTMGNSIWSLELNGARHEIFKADFDMQAYSIVVRKNGELWVGGANGVLQLTPKGKAYASHWFLPVDKAVAVRIRRTSQ